MVSALDLVKKQILLAISSLSVPTHRKLDDDELEAACSAAKMLRNRLLREVARVSEVAKELRQMIDDGMASREAVEVGEGADANWESDGEEYGEQDVYERRLRDESNSIPQDRTNQLHRHEFVFLGEMMVMERIVLPLLLAHGMQYPDSLLPQLLKLVTAMLSPIPRLSLDRDKQHDLLQRIRNRCAADEFFAVLIQAIAPIAEKRKELPLSEEEGMLLELVLTLLSNLTSGRRDDIEPVVGALCRNHGMELLLVVVNQNHMKLMHNQEPEENDFLAAETENAARSETAKEVTEIEVNNNNFVHAVDEDSEEDDNTEVALQGGTNGHEIRSFEVPLEETLVILADGVDDNNDTRDIEKGIPLLPASGHSDADAQISQPQCDDALNDAHDAIVLPANDNETDDIVVDPDVFAPLSACGSSGDDDDASDTDDGLTNERAEPEEPEAATAASRENPRSTTTTAEEYGKENEEAEEEEEEEYTETDEEDEHDSSANSSSSATDDDQPAQGVVLQGAENLFFGGGEGEERLDVVENSDALHRWNDLAMKCISFILSCVSPIELAQLRCNADLTGQMSSSNVPVDREASPQQTQGKSSITGKRSYFQSDFANHKREIDNLRLIARSRNGATVSSGLLVRNQNESSGIMHGYNSQRHEDQNGGGDANASLAPGSWAFRRTIGSINSVYGLHHHNPIDVAQELDLKKRGRFIKGMYEETRVTCNLPLPTKLSLAYQCEAFLCHGFEPLTEMVWPLLRQTFSEMEQEMKENKEVSASFRGTGETVEVQMMEYGAADDGQRAKMERVLQFMNIASSLLRFTREALRLAREQPSSVKIDVAAHCKPLSHILTLDYIQGGLNFYAMCTSIKYIKNNSQLITIVISYVGEMLLLLQQFLQGGIVDDAAIHMAAQALASTVLYKEENIASIFLHLPDSPQRRPPAQRVQSTILLLHAAFSLMEACSFNGALMLPKRKAPVSRRDRNGVVDEAEADADDETGLGENDGDESSDDDENDGEDGDEGEDEDERENTEAAQSTTTTPGLALESMGSQINGEEEEEGAGNIPAAENDLDETEASIEIGSPSHLLPDPGDEEEHRAASVSSSHPSSVHPSSSVNTATSSLASEREISVSSFVQRLASVRYVGILLFALQSWRINDVDVNLGLVFLLNRIMARHIGVLMNAPFLIAMRDVIQHGKRTHRPLYDVCDSIVYLFFNPQYARNLDEQWISKRERECDQLSHTVHNDDGDEKGLSEAESVPKLAGVSSFFGFEVSLRCVRSLFTVNATDYRILEEKIMSGLTTGTEIDLPSLPYLPSTEGETANPEITHATESVVHNFSDDENDEADERSAESTAGSGTSGEAAATSEVHNDSTVKPKKRKRSRSRSRSPRKKQKAASKRKSKTKKSNGSMAERENTTSDSDYALLSYYGNNNDSGTSKSTDPRQYDTAARDSASDTDDVAFLLRD